MSIHVFNTTMLLDNATISTFPCAPSVLSYKYRTGLILYDLWHQVIFNFMGTSLQYIFATISPILKPIHFIFFFKLKINSSLILSDYNFLSFHSYFQPPPLSPIHLSVITLQKKIRPLRDNSQTQQNQMPQGKEKAISPELDKTTPTR